MDALQIQAHWRYPEQIAKDLRHTNRILYHQVQRNLQEYTDHIHNRKVWKKVCQRAGPELLATAVKLCSVVCNNRLWNFSRYT